MKIDQLWLSEPLLDLEANGFVRIENYLGILEFTDLNLKLKMKNMIYEIQGKNLTVRAVSKREIFLEGEIHTVQIIRETTA